MPAFTGAPRADSLLGMNDFTHSVIVLPVRDGKVALAERMAGTRMAGQFVTPGGGVDPEDATFRAAALRELREETALDVPEARLKYLGHVTAKGSDWMPVGGHFFLLHLEESEQLARTEPDGLGPWVWYTFADAAALPLAPVTQTLIHLLAHTASRR